MIVECKILNILPDKRQMCPQLFETSKSEEEEKEKQKSHQSSYTQLHSHKQTQ